MKPLIALSLSAIVLSGCIGMTPNRDRGSLKVASWNIEHLAERDGEGCSPRTEADYARLRDHVRALDADVIAFQEVQNKTAAERRALDTPPRPQRAGARKSGPAMGRGCDGVPGATGSIAGGASEIRLQLWPRTDGS